MQDKGLEVTVSLPLVMRQPTEMPRVAHKQVM